MNDLPDIQHAIANGWVQYSSTTCRDLEQQRTLMKRLRAERAGKDTSQFPPRKRSKSFRTKLFNRYRERLYLHLKEEHGVKLGAAQMHAIEKIGCGFFAPRVQP